MPGLLGEMMARYIALLDCAPACISLAGPLMLLAQMAPSAWNLPDDCDCLHRLTDNPISACVHDTLKGTLHMT